MAEAAPIYPVRIAWMVALDVFKQGLGRALGKVPGAECMLAAANGADLLAALQQGMQVDLVMVLVLPQDLGEMQLLRTLRASYPHLILVAVLYEPELDHYDVDFDGGATIAIPAKYLTKDRAHRLVEEVRAELMARA